MKTLMILGASGAQLNAIQRAKDMGYKVVATDYYEDSIGKKVADYSGLASTFDPRACLEVAMEHHIDGIMTTGTDQPVYVVSKVATAMNLPRFLSRETAYQVTNKRAMKKKFRSYHIPTPDYRLIGRDFLNHELDGLAFPVVVKPLDSQGQRGIYKLYSIEEIRDHYPLVNQHSREDAILVESYYANDEITVSGWVRDGEVTVLTITDRVTFEDEKHIGICTSHEFPSKHYKNHGDELMRLTHRLVEVFQIKNGPIYFQLFVGDRGIMVNEIACRIGGAYEDEFIPYITGVDILKLVIEGSMGEVSDVRALEAYDMQHNNHYLSVQLFFARPGYVKSMTKREEILALDGVVNMHYNYRPGDSIGQLENASQRAGYVIVTGRTREEVNERVDRVYTKMQMLDQDGSNMIIQDNGDIYRQS